MDWLSPTAQSEIHEAALRRHEVGTGQWFLGSTTFENWRADPGASLWLCGEGLEPIKIFIELDGADLNKSVAAGVVAKLCYSRPLCNQFKGSNNPLA